MVRSLCGIFENIVPHYSTHIHIEPSDQNDESEEEEIDESEEEEIDESEEEEIESQGGQEQDGEDE